MPYEPLSSKSNRGRQQPGYESRLTRLECGHEVVGIPGCEFSLSLDGLFAGHGADEVEGQGNHPVMTAGQVRCAVFVRGLRFQRLARPASSRSMASISTSVGS